MRTVVIFTFAYVIDKLFEKTADAFTVVVKLSVQSAAGNTGRLMKNVSVGTGANSTFKDGTAIDITLNADTIVVVKAVVASADGIVGNAFIEAGIVDAMTLIVDKSVNETIV